MFHICPCSLYRVSLGAVLAKPSMFHESSVACPTAFPTSCLTLVFLGMEQAGVASSGLTCRPMMGRRGTPRASMRGRNSHSKMVKSFMKSLRMSLNFTFCIQSRSEQPPHRSWAWTFWEVEVPVSAACLVSHRRVIWFIHRRTHVAFRLTPHASLVCRWFTTIHRHSV